MGSVVIKCIKYLLFLFNLIFAISGIIVLTIGVIIQQQYYSYKVFIDEKFLSTPGIFIIVGVFIFVVAFFGCCGAINESNYMLITFAILLCLIFILEIAGGVAGFIMKDDVYDMLETRMNSTLKSYNSSDIVKKTWNIVQHDFSCCGVKSYSDWSSVFLNGGLPHSCCLYRATDEECSPNFASIEGCLSKLQGSLERNTFIIANFGLAVAFVQFIGVIFACYLSRSIHRNETV